MKDAAISTTHIDSSHARLAYASSKANITSPSDAIAVVCLFLLDVLHLFLSTVPF
jgi:hypothetical protein